MGPRRPDPVDLLTASLDGLLEQLLPIRWGRMAQSPFACFRGTAELMAADLARIASTSLTVQLCGDAHVGNFGGFATAERNLVFDLNDFDETLPGPFEWDVKRLAASVVLAGRDRGIAPARCETAARQAVRAYRKEMARFAAMPALDVWYARIDAAEAVGSIRAATAERREAALEKTRKRTSARLLPRLTSLTADGRRIDPAPPLVIPLRDPTLRDAVVDLATTYGEHVSPELRHLLGSYEVLDVALKVVGVGSVGTRCLIVLLAGRDDDDILFLQVKEALRSSLEPHLPPTTYAHQGERVVRGQRLVQAAGDPFLGWTSAVDREFYVRQLHDMKGSFDLTRLTKDTLGDYAALCGRALSRAHARSGDPVALAGYLGGSGTFDRAIAAGAVVYADRAEQDHARLLEAIRDGRLPTDADESAGP